MRLGDRIAFACRYLADDQLDAYIEEQVKVRFTGRWREETAGRGGARGNIVLLTSHALLTTAPSQEVARLGQLDGLLLTGLTPAGLDLLASYVDRTSDVQTVSMLATVALSFLGSGSAASTFYGAGLSEEGERA